MPLILTYTSKVRQALKEPAGFGVDVLLLFGLAGLIAALVAVFGQASSQMHETVVINLSLWALPKYAMFSLSRGFAAYILSLVFTLIYGTIAAHNHTAEKLMIPALDILQSLPVLSFLPGIVLAMVQLFPTREIGLELACVITIFTSQVWNMTFSFHGSLRSIPTAMREAAAINGLSGWQIFRLLEVPASMIGLVWNSMMSMAGGWFFLTVEEAFQLNGRDFKLPGIGSYMQDAIDKGDHVAQIAAVVAMIVMIVAVDQIFWGPIVVWSQRFRLDDSTTDVPNSWMVSLFRRSIVLRWINRLRSHAKKKTLELPPKKQEPKPIHVNNIVADRLMQIGTYVVLLTMSASALWGMYRLAGLLLHLPIHDHTAGIAFADRQDWTVIVLALLASFSRIVATVVIGVAWTLPVGIIIGLSPTWSRRLQPVLQVLASFPAPMLFPLVYVILIFLRIPFGVGCISLMLLGAQWYILFNVVAGATAIPSQLREAGEIYNMTRSQRWKKIYVPSVFPYLVTGLITAAGGAWNATIVSEALSVPGKTVTTFGIGSIIANTSSNGQYAMLAAAVVSLSLFVVLLNRLIWKRLYRLAENRYSLNV